MPQSAQEHGDERVEVASGGFVFDLFTQNLAITSQGDIEIALEPTAERHMPASPELLRVAGFVGRIEVLRQREAQQQGDTDGDIRIAREIGIDLQRIGKERKEVLEAGEEQRVVEDTVDEVDRQVIAEDDLLDKTIQDPEHRQAKQTAREAEGAVELRNELVGTHNRSRHQAREETDIKTKI